MFPVTYEDGNMFTEVVVSCEEATQPFILHELDKDFIEQDILESGAVNGELEAIVEEGLLTFWWECKGKFMSK